MSPVSSSVVDSTAVAMRMIASALDGWLSLCWATLLFALSVMAVLFIGCRGRGIAADPQEGLAVLQRC